MQKWTRMVIKAPTQLDGDFGSAVALSRSTLVVGSPFFGDSTSRGRIWVYSSSNNWKNKPVSLTAPNATTFWGEDDIAVAESGKAVVAGDRTYDKSRGAAFLYVQNSNGKWISNPTIIRPNNPTSIHNFGWSVAISDATLVVAAIGTWDDPGAVYIYTYSGKTIKLQQIINGPSRGNYFGDKLALSGDILAISGHSDAETLKPAVYIYHRNNNKWSFKTGLKLPEILNATVSAVKAFYGDYLVVMCYPNSMVGAQLHMGQTRFLGIFKRASPYGSKWKYLGKLSDPQSLNSNEGDHQFGTSVGVNSVGTVVVGVPGEDGVYPYGDPENGWAALGAARVYSIRQYT